MPLNLCTSDITVGRYIKNVRRALYLTQKELAERSGINMNFLSRIECGEQNPSFETLKFIAEGLGCDLILEFRKKEKVEA